MNLYISQVPASYNSTKLREAFSKFGAIHSSKVMFDPLTNESRCFGFVLFKSARDGARAMAAMNGVVLEEGSGRLHVRVARPTALPEPLRGDAPQNASNSFAPNNTVPLSMEQQRQFVHAGRSKSSTPDAPMVIVCATPMHSNPSPTTSSHLQLYPGVHQPQSHAQPHIQMGSNGHWVNAAQVPPYTAAQGPMGFVTQTTPPLMMQHSSNQQQLSLPQMWIPNGPAVLVDAASPATPAAVSSSRSSGTILTPVVATSSWSLSSPGSMHPTPREHAAPTLVHCHPTPQHWHHHTTVQHDGTFVVSHPHWGLSGYQ